MFMSNKKVTQRRKKKITKRHSGQAGHNGRVSVAGYGDNRSSEQYHYQQYYGNGYQNGASENHEIPYGGTTVASSAGYDEYQHKGAGYGEYKQNETATRESHNVHESPQQNQWSSQGTNPDVESSQQRHPGWQEQQPPAGGEGTTDLSFITEWCSSFGLDRIVFEYLRDRKYTTGDDICGLYVDNVERMNGLDDSRKYLLRAAVFQYHHGRPSVDRKLAHKGVVFKRSDDPKKTKQSSSTCQIL